MIYPFKKTVFNCKQATLLSLKKDEGKISFPERIKLLYHLLYCGICRRFIRQSHLLNTLTKGQEETLLEEPPYTLSPESRENIQRQIDLLNP
jgi:hypothetical protein